MEIPTIISISPSQFLPSIGHRTISFSFLPFFSRLSIDQHRQPTIERSIAKKKSRVVANKSATRTVCGPRWMHDFMESRRRGSNNTVARARSRAVTSESVPASETRVWETRRMHYVFIALLT